MRFEENDRGQRKEDPYASYRPKDIYGSTGFYVWEQEEAGAGRFLRLRLFYLAGMILAAFLLIIGLSIFSIRLPVQTRTWFLLAAVVGITLFLAVGAYQIGIRSQGLLCVFVRDEWGRIYLFDYTMPRLSEIYKDRFHRRFPWTEPFDIFGGCLENGESAAGNPPEPGGGESHGFRRRERLWK